MVERLLRLRYGRLAAMWNVLRGRPTMYRTRTGPIVFLEMQNAVMLECFIDGNVQPTGAGISFR